MAPTSSENKAANKKAQPDKDDAAKKVSPDAKKDVTKKVQPGKDDATKSKTQKPAAVAAKPLQGFAAKGGLLAVLSVQHCLVGLITRQSRTTGTGQFLPQTGVICQEILKGSVCLILVISSGESLINVFSNPRELAKASVPALLYLVQNNLQYVALAYLDPATYVVTYQLKILSTALMSVLLLKRELSIQKWFALVLLVVGVSTVQLSSASTSATVETKPGAYSQQFLGLAAVLVTCALSGLAGVYTEFILKQSTVSLWARNVQLAVFSIAIGVLGLVVTDDLPKVQLDGFFQGYNAWVCASVVNNSFGGLLIAVIIKYADNIIKNFATAVSIVLATAASIYALGLTFTPAFFSGVAIVCCSTFLYGGAFDDLLRRFSAPQKEKLK